MQKQIKRLSNEMGNVTFISLTEKKDEWQERIFVRSQKLSSVILMVLLMSTGPPSCSRPSNIDLLILIILLFSNSGLNFWLLEFDVAQIIPAVLHMLATMGNNFFLTDFFFTRFFKSKDNFMMKNNFK